MRTNNWIIASSREEAEEYAADNFNRFDTYTEAETVLSHNELELTSSERNLLGRQDIYLVQVLSWKVTKIQRIGLGVGKVVDEIKNGKVRLSEPLKSEGGKCCACGYIGKQDTDCPKREDNTHCFHWFDKKGVLNADG